MKPIFCITLFFYGQFTLLAQSVQFEKYYDYGYAEAGNAVDQTSDGGYIIFGRQGITIGVSKILLIKVDSLGTELWHKLIGNANTDNYAYAGQQTSDGGYIMTGFTGIAGQGLNIYLVKTDSNGDTLWTRNFGDVEADIGWSVQQTNDGGYIVAAKAVDMNDTTGKAFLIKTDANGDTIWTKKFIDTDAVTDAGGSSVQQTPDNGYILCGSSGLVTGGIYLVKTDELGDTLWTKCINTSHIMERGLAVRYTPDGGYIVGGYVWTGTTNDMLWLKTDSNGDTLWTKTLGGGSDNYITSVSLAGSNGYVILGSTSSFSASGYNIILIRTGINGDTLWIKQFTSSLSESSGWSDVAVQQTSDGGFVFVGMTDLGNASAYLIKTDSTGFVVLGTPEALWGEFSFSVYPNPCVENATILIPDNVKDFPDLSVSIYDLSGRCIQKTLLDKGKSHHPVSLNNFSAGIYILQLQNENSLLGSIKIIIQ